MSSRQVKTSSVFASGERANERKWLHISTSTTELTIPCASHTFFARRSKKDFENVIGSLQSIIDKDSKKREARSEALSDAGPPLSKLKRFGASQVDDISTTILCKFDNKNFTLKAFSKTKIVDAKFEKTIMREIDLLKSMSKYKLFSECSCIGAMKSTYTDKVSCSV